MLRSTRDEAFDNLWALQFRNGELKGAWAWLNCNEPWEGNGSAYFGAALAAIAVGTAPGEYAASQDIQDRLTLFAAISSAALIRRACSIG